MKPPRLSSLISPHCYDFTYLTGSMLPLLLFSYRDMESFDEDWNKINHINKITVWQQTRTKYKVAFPHLYNSLPHSMHIQGCQRVNSRITRTRIALTRSHTDHSQRVTRFPRVSRIKSLLVYESLALNCHCPFISDIALTPAAAAADHSLMLAARRRFHLPSSLSLGA